LSALAHLLPEMEFWLPATQLPARAVDALCRQHLLPDLPAHAVRPTLVERELHGLVMGFADLVFEHEGRYWVLDYKSNQLGADGRAYTAAALAQAMALHRYDVQAALYQLALHRLLRQRLGEAYDPAQHLGGALYLFLRGLDGPTRGLYLVPPDLALLDALDALLTQEAPV
jgi:exodeoxyribonuclease V beta subunit